MCLRNERLRLRDTLKILALVFAFGKGKSYVGVSPPKVLILSLKIPLSGTAVSVSLMNVPHVNEFARVHDLVACHSVSCYSLC